MLEIAITFRHHQNSSFGKDGQEHSLDSFFKYSQTYSEEDLKSFLPVPQQLTWIHVSDPTADDASVATPPPPSHTPTTSDTVQQVAAHTLEALSTAAADQTTHPPQGTAYYTTANPATEYHPEYGFVQTEPGGPTSGGLSRNIHYYLSSSSPQNQTDTSLIDPNLESTVTTTAPEGEQLDMARDEKPQGADKDQKEQEDSLTDSDTRVAMALRTFNELQA
ncbi:uncharacterized protein A1O5_05961 [Cladophialophora psammophila CBS 110553]|uniref:Uncharacterized protein n=1 Tax=Cladophialophora psammophila CBS 110553 TaxID=1182543 RepID=W9WSR1_9EURO|nr:uncharacterized protein A1O5_05961 [Cladophialophora psammophila CBS 110553]EXJ70968.1 hypothetical protein A1O5_05961 [Cladophialophora psammophila CBS 110553]